MLKPFTIFLSISLAMMEIAHPQLHEKNFLSIDHVPIVVGNLDNARKLFKQKLHFTIKEGSVHEGIQNFFLKFKDGTYLEFTTPLDSKKTIGKYYADFIKKRQGGTKLAVSVANADSIMKYLLKRKFTFERDENKVWETVSPAGVHLFFIEYTNKNWKDSKANTTHTNNALSLRSTYILSDNISAEVTKYENYGFKQVNSISFLNIPSKQFTIGKNKLYILDASKANELKEKISFQNSTGICGFQIQVRSLSSINKLLTGLPNVQLTKKNTIIFLNKYNFFLEFCE